MTEALSGCAVRAEIQREKIREQADAVERQIQDIRRGILELQAENKTLRAENDRLRLANHEADVTRRTAKFLLMYFGIDTTDVLAPMEVAKCITELQREIDLGAERAG